MRYLTLIFLLLGALPLWAQDSPSNEPQTAYTSAATSIRSDLETELKRLAEVRQSIAKEKAELGASSATIAAELREKRRQADLARLRSDDLTHDLNTLTQRVRVWQDENNYIDSLLVEFRKQYEADSHPAAIEKIRDLLDAAEGTNEEAFSARIEITNRVTEFFSSIRGPIAMEGDALDAEGRSHSGEFLLVGPVSWFRSRDGSTSGLTDLANGLQPAIIQGTADSQGIANIAAGNRDDLTFDPSLGAAVALKNADGSLLDHLRQGGTWIWPILALALLATIAAIAKWFQLLRIRGFSPTTVSAVVQDINQGNPDAASSRLEGNRHPAAAILRRGVDLADGTRTRDAMEEALYEKFLAALPSLQRGLPLIAIASASAPLLGLLGTVTGMIHTFKLINIFGTGDAKSLASGISEALVTTEFGLIVAIPALILHALLSRKVQGIKSTMEMSSLAFLNGIKKIRE